jgi:predicted nucleotidyltransferase
MNLDKQIAFYLHDIATTHGVRILNAVEVGSHAWGLNNEDSDHDVGFIYVRPAKEYFRINAGHRDTSLQSNRDTLELKAAGFGDITGYDISKALDMIYQSNPTIADWLRLPSYFEHDVTEKLRELMRMSYSPLKLRQLNISTVKRNYKAYIEGRSHVPVKKYLHTVRPLLNAIWYERTREFGLDAEYPPYDYMQLCTVAGYDHDFLQACVNLFQLKQEGRIMIERYIQLDRIIEEKLNEKKVPEGLTRVAPPIEEYDKLFAKIALSDL